MFWVSSGICRSEPADFALKPESPRRPAGALSPRARADRRLRRRRPARGARCCAARVRVLALTSSPQRVAELRAAGITPLRGQPGRAAHAGAGWPAWPTRVVHLAPPPPTARRSGGATRARWRCCARCACAAPPRAAGLWLHQRRLRRLRRRAGRRDARRRAAHAARAAPRRCRGAGAPLRPRGAACAPASCASPASTRPTAKAARRASACCKGTPVLRARGRRLHQPHPRRRPGARRASRRCGAAGRSASTTSATTAS